MELLERDPQIAELDAGLAEVAQGRGCLVLVSGEAGIGKISLVQRFTSRQQVLNQVMWGSSDALFTPRLLGPLYDMLPQMGRDLQKLLSSDAQRNTVFSALLRRKFAHRSPYSMTCIGLMKPHSIFCVSWDGVSIGYHRC